MNQVVLSGFADEAASNKTIDQQFSTMAALGLQHLSLRFIDAGSGIKSVLDLNEAELSITETQLQEYRLSVSSIGSPIGKVKIDDFDDGTKNRFVPFDQYLELDVASACRVANRFGSKLIRGFSFYHPRDSNHSSWLNQSIDQVGQIAEVCDTHGLTFGLEVEANLIGHTGSILKQMHADINHPALVLIFDGGNLVTQGFTASEILAQFRDMLPGLGWMHVKDYASASSINEANQGAKQSYIDEEALDRFVPANQGGSGHLAIFQELRSHLPEIMTRLQDRQVSSFYLDLEPHLRGGGQFGGYSGPDGMGVALRALCQVLEQSELNYQLTNFSMLGKSNQ